MKEHAPFPPLLIRASAGTGKTFELSGRFLAILLSGERPDRILATTFTRKAAGEIRERILSRLVAAARSEHAATTLGNEVGVTGIAQKRVIEVLAHVVDMQHRLRICTLDGLFSQIARGFFGELGLSPDWRLQDDEESERALQEAIHRMIQSAGALTTRQLLARLPRAEATVRVIDTLMKSINESHFLYRGSSRDAWRGGEAGEPPSRESFLAAAQRIDAIPPPLTKSGTPHKRFVQKMKELSMSLRSGGIGDLADSPLLQRSLSDAQYDRVQIEDPLLSELREAAMLTGRALARNIHDETLAIWELLSAFDRARQVCGGHAGVSFEDLKQLLARSSYAGNLEEVYFRLDSRIHHLLLDEFQDTSPADWAVVSPFADEILAKGGREFSFFCVGDVKQAIYGWRGGVAEIFDSLERRWSQLITETREKSYRCSPAVVELVNRFFSTVPTSEALSEFPEARRAWTERFRVHIANRLTPQGRVEVALREEGEDWSLQVAEEVARIRSRVGDAPSIGVLVSKNDGVRAISDALRARGISVSEEGGSSLDTVQPVSQILSLLHWIDHPADTVSWQHMLLSPLMKLFEISTRASVEDRGGIARELRARIVDDGLPRFVAACAAQYGNPAPSGRKLGQLVQLASEFEARGSSLLRMEEFIHYVEKTRIDDPLAASVRVMTVFQAKGLEFDVVLLPDLHEPLIKGSPWVVGEYLHGRTEPPTRVTRSAPESVLNFVPEVRSIVQSDKEMRVIERLCVAYVALTRACHETVVLLRHGKGAKVSAHSVGAVVMEALHLSEQSPVVVIGDEDWAEYRPKEGSLAEPARHFLPPTVHLKEGNSRTRRGLHRERPSVSSSSPLSDSDRGTTQMQRGRVMHALCESIEWIEGEASSYDEERAIALLRSSQALRDVLDDSLRTEGVRSFRRYLAAGLDRVFMRSRFLHAGRQIESVYRELPFAVLVEGALLTGVIDRVVLFREGDRKGAELLDFKLSVNDGEARTRYREQLEKYQSAAARIFQLGVTSIEAGLVDVPSGKIWSLAEL